MSTKFVNESNTVLQLQRRRLRLEKVILGLEVGLTNDRCRVEIVHRDTAQNSSGTGSIVLLPRHARYLANLLVDYATEAEDIGTDCDSNLLHG